MGLPVEDRRKYGGLTEEQVEVIRQAILDSVYKEIGKSVVKWVLWVGGTIFLTFVAWLAGAGKIKIL